MNPSAPHQATSGKKGRPPAWPKLRTITERSGRISYRVDAGQFGGNKRLVRQFPTLEQANDYAEELRGLRATQQEAERFERQHRAVSLANLSDTHRADVLAAYRALEGTGGTLLRAVDFWKKHAAPASAKTVAEVHVELLAAMRAANRRPRSMNEVRTRITGFITTHGARPIASVTIFDLETWINERCDGLTARTRQHTRRVLHRLFAFAVRRGYRDNNPVAAIDKPTAEDTRPEIFTPAQVRRLMAAATERAPKMVPYFALGFFAGLRSSEIEATDWRSIDLARREIHVDSAVAKKRRARYVKIESNLAEWLAPHKQAAGPIYHNRDAFELVRVKAEVNWPHNVMRHSFGSYHLAAFEDAPRTAAQLGHANDTAQLFAHYRSLVRGDDARDYWMISPKPAKVLKFPQEATA